MPCWATRCCCCSGFALVWLGIWVGSLMRTVEAVQGLMFTVMFPLTFVANTFAPSRADALMAALIAEWNPVSALTQACRELWGNGIARRRRTRPGRSSTQIVASIVWSIVLTAIFAPLALAAYRRRSRD